MSSLSYGYMTQGDISVRGNTLVMERDSAFKQVDLNDILEADFNDTDFYLDYFSSHDNPAHLPPDWRGLDIGEFVVPGAFTYADGTLTVSGCGGEEGKSNRAKHGGNENFYFLGRPWRGDGQWSVHVKDLDSQTPRAQVGIMLRKSYHPDEDAMFGYDVSSDGGILYLRGKTGRTTERRRYPGQVPIWLRLTCFNGVNIDVETSTDDKSWDLILQDTFREFSSDLAGFFYNSFSAKDVGKAVLDQIAFTPPPAQPETVLPGVLLRSGTFLAGLFNDLDDKNGQFNRNGKLVTMTTDQVAAVVWAPTTRQQIASVASQVGLIMKNGDFLAADFSRVRWDTVDMNSLLLGPINYRADNLVRACVLHPVSPKSANYEVRLKDGSIIYASGMEGDMTKAPAKKKISAAERKKQQVTIKEISGIDVIVSEDEISRFRAGPAKVQPLIGLPWTVTPPSIGGNHAAHSAVDPSSLVSCWEGNNQEQIMAIASGATLHFPVKGQVHGVAMRIALPSNASPDERASLRILADGREVNHTPSIRKGNPPQFVQVNLSRCQTISFECDAYSPDARLLIIDPVVIRSDE